MNSVNKINNVIDSNVLIKELTQIPDYGASKQEIEDIEVSLGNSIDENYKKILYKWDGLDLDVIRIFSISSRDPFLKNIIENQNEDLPDMIAFGSDPAGFLYLFDKHGTVYAYDHDGGDIEKVASNFEEFICDYIFGARAAEFGGEEWLQELKDAGLV